MEMAGNTVYVQGSYVDVHDNDVVNLSIDKAGLVRVDHTREDATCRTVDKQLLARVIENCQSYFWANSAYAMVYCICRDDFKMKISHGDFENLIVELPFKKKVRQCPAGTIDNAFRDNPIFKEHIDNWENFNPMSRIIKLRDELRKGLKSQ